MTTRGFTLVETMIALGLFAFAVMGFMIALESAVSSARYLRREAVVRQVLENRVAAVLADKESAFRREFPADANGIEVVEEGKEEKVYDQEGTILSDYFRVTVKASWKDQRGEKNEREVSFLKLAE